MQKRFNTDKNNENTFKLFHKVRYHCHYTGGFRGAAHNICNLRYKTPNKIPVIFHNGSTNDYHFIIKQHLKISLNAQVKIQKSILLFQYQLKKKLITVKQLNTN